MAGWSDVFGSFCRRGVSLDSVRSVLFRGSGFFCSGYVRFFVEFSLSLL